MTTPLVEEFRKWLAVTPATDTADSHAICILQDAFEAGCKVGLKEGVENGKTESIAVMRKFFETDFVNCLDAIEEILL